MEKTFAFYASHKSYAGAIMVRQENDKYIFVRVVECPKSEIDPLRWAEGNTHKDEVLLNTVGASVLKVNP